MDGLDFLLCTGCTLLIWLLWQQLEKVKAEERRGKLMKVHNGKEVKTNTKQWTHERIIIEEMELNFKKLLLPSLPTPSLPLSPPSKAILPPPSSSPLPLPSPHLPSSSRPLSASPSPVSSTTAIPTTPTTSSSNGAKEVDDKSNKSNETGPEWGPFGKQEIRPQQPWVFEGEAYYPPNFFTAAHQK
uniref:Uncharacterized protein n=1 Tax=Setaria digitata TaxID=48799 RepID=A0A915PUV8_9BILA